MIGNVDIASFDMDLDFECGHCGSKDFMFQIVNGEIDSPYADSKLGVIGVDCANCGYGYSVNLKLKDIKMNFGKALEELKNGKKVAREGWNGKNMFLFLVSGSTFKVNRAPLLGIYPEGTEINYQPHIDMKTVDNTIVPWLASQSDILANDWLIVN